MTSAPGVYVGLDANCATSPRCPPISTGTGAGHRLRRAAGRATEVARISRRREGGRRDRPRRRTVSSMATRPPDRGASTAARSPRSTSTPTAPASSRSCCSHSAPPQYGIYERRRQAAGANGALSGDRRSGAVSSSPGDPLIFLAGDTSRARSNANSRTTGAGRMGVNVATWKAASVATRRRDDRADVRPAARSRRWTRCTSSRSSGSARCYDGRAGVRRGLDPRASSVSQ